jgi:hypothetical protein
MSASCAALRKEDSNARERQTALAAVQATQQAIFARISAAAAEFFATGDAQRNGPPGGAPALPFFPRGRSRKLSSRSFSD